MEDAVAPGQPAAPTEAQPSDKAKAPAQAGPGGAAAPAAAADGNPLKDAAAEAMRKYKLKVDGQEIEVDEEELKRGYTHQKAANKKLQEGLKYRRQSEDFVKAMKNPETLVDTLYKLGYTPQQMRQLSENYLAQVLEDEMLDPKDKELKTTKQKLQEFEKKEEERKSAAQKAHEDAMKKKFAEKYSNEFVEALKTSGLPPTKAMVAEMAKYIKRAADVKVEMTADEAAKLVKEDQENHYRALYGEADPETLAKLLGDQGLQKVRTYDTSRIKDPAAQLKTPDEQGERRKREGIKRMTPQEWREFNRK